MLVTGGAGFLGAALCRALAASERAVLALDDLSSGRRERLEGRNGPSGSGHLRGIELVVGDVRDTRLLAELVARSGLVVHLAARVGVRRILAAPAACARENVAGVESLIAALTTVPAASRPRVLFASTSEVYAPSDAPLHEASPLRESASDGRYAYATSKRRGEELLDACGLWAPGRAPIHLRFFNVVGPGQDSSSGMVLPTFLEQAARGAPLPIHGDGSQERTYAHVDDVAAIVARLCGSEGDRITGPLNVGGRARATVLELARCVIARSGSRAGWSFVDARAELGAGFAEVPTRRADLSRLEALLGPIDARALDAIVADAWSRHASLARSAPLRSCASLAS